MPKRFFKYSRTEPARTILFVVAALTLIAQAATLLPIITPPAMLFAQLINVIIVCIPCALGLRATLANNVKGMSRWSFWLFVIWVWSGLARLAFAADPTQLLWVPMLIVAVVLGIIHVYMEGLRKGGDSR